MSVELGLSTISLIMALAGLSLHFVKFRKERPNLNIELIKCRHNPSSTKVKKTELRLQFYVHNRGDRATQLNSLELQEHKQACELEDAVEANKSIKKDCYFNLPKRLTDDKIKCTFILYHTHATKKFEVTSEKTSKSLSKFGVAYVDW